MRTVTVFPLWLLDHPDVQSLNNYILFYFCFATEILEILGCVVYRLKGNIYNFPTVYYKSQNF